MSAETPPRDAVLEVDNLSVILGARSVLNGVSFSLNAGEFAGLIGANGAGKTTLIKVILGLISPTDGRVLIKGVPRSGNSLIGYVPQKIDLDPDMPLRARDLIALGLDGHRYGIPRRSARRSSRVQEMVESVGAGAFADQRIGNLSGGEQQRVMIAHALISQPSLLLLDEPLANLDLRSGQEVVALLARIAAEQQVGILLSAHDMNPLLPVMDRVVYLADGRAASGSAEEIIRADTLSELYRHPVEVVRVGDRVLVIAGHEQSIQVLGVADANVDPHQH